MPADQELFRRAMDYDGGVQGMTANAFASVSLEPLLVLVCVDQKARTHAHLHARKRFGINILAENQRAVSEHYADPERVDPWPEVQFDRTQHGTPVLHGALAYLECRLQNAQDAGDHTIFIAQVEDIVVRPGRPLLYFQTEYHNLGSKSS
jgi:flavin reductase (DIM6/NTAB) family NADH-FMN oxidoreductase RutF